MKERLHEILHIALRHNVSDIHFTMKRQSALSIEMRVDNTMRRIRAKEEDERFLHYLMYRANLDVADTMDPQTGAFEENMDGINISMRFAYVESYYLASAVLRILNVHADLRISDLTFDSPTIDWLSSITKHRSGFYVLSGPTGSGKTTSLYTILNAVKGKSIYTLEDPVEVFNEKYVQIQINDQQHLSYADGIKQLMRHDPDIVMIGEIRDETAAVNAVRCALTGHLVLTSIHSSSCINAINRLLDLHVNPQQLKDVLGGVANQRLYRTKNNKRIGIYEIMDRKEVKQWFESRTTSEKFIPLEERIKEAVREGFIREEDAQSDLIV